MENNILVKGNKEMKLYVRLLLIVLLLFAVLAGLSLSTSPTQAQETCAFSQVSAGGQHTCAVKTDGSLACWGENDHGQTNVPAGIVVSQVSAGFDHTCAVKTDGSLACWGWIVGDVPAGIDFSQVSAGYEYSCAVKTDGSLACWGWNVYGQTNVPAGIVVSQVSLGDTPHTCAVKTDGSLACWGWNLNGQTNVPAGIVVSQVSAGGYHTCAVKTDGSLACWGSNSYGQASPPSCNTPPEADAGGPYSGDEGSTITLDGAGSFDPDGDPLTYSWSVDSDLCEFSDSSSANPEFMCDDNGDFTVTLTVDDGQATDYSSTTVQVANVAPSATFANTSDPYLNLPNTICAGESATFEFTNQYDPSTADLTAGFTYWVDCGNGDTDAESPFTCTYYPNPDESSTIFQARGRITDKDGGSSDYPIPITVLAPTAAMDNMITAVEQLNLAQGLDNSLTAKLESAKKALEDMHANNDVAAINSLHAFINAVEAQRGKGITDKQADTLISNAQRVINSLTGG